MSSQPDLHPALDTLAGALVGQGKFAEAELHVNATPAVAPSKQLQAGANPLFAATCLSARTSGYLVRLPAA